jgi:hypothetical protein
MVGLLHLAATQDCEQAIGEAVLQILSQQRQPSLSQLQQQFGAVTTEPPDLLVSQHQLSSYDGIAQVAKEVCNG